MSLRVFRKESVRASFRVQGSISGFGDRDTNLMVAVSMLTIWDLTLVNECYSSNGCIWGLCASLYVRVGVVLCCVVLPTSINWLHIGW